MSERNHSYHIPVLLNECIEALQIKPEGVYIDATFGGGGHSKPILKRLGAKGRLYGIDQDIEAAANALKDDRFIFIRSNFRYLMHFMKYYGVDKVDGILADLGVSSHHFDDAKRGFSYRFDTDLDMRMNQSISFTAKDLLNTYSDEHMLRVFSEYGEIRNARTLTRKVVRSRETRPFQRSKDLSDLCDEVAMGDPRKYKAQVFQALRIEVNDELGSLKSFLEQIPDLLKSRGRMVVISYHSLEDKWVKRLIRTGRLKGGAEKDDFGKSKVPFKAITKRPIVPSREEIRANSRAASAKLRVAEKIDI